MTAKNRIYRAIINVRWLPVASISLVSILTAMLLPASLEKYQEWRSKAEHFKTWSQSGQADKCLKINQYCGNLFKEKSLLPANKEKHENIFMTSVEEMTCIEAELAKQGVLECSVLEPNSFSMDLKNMIFNNLLLEDSFFLWACFLALIFTARTLIKERHEGWRRLTLVLAPILAALIFNVVTWDQSTSVPHGIAIGYSALIFSTLALLAGKNVFYWVVAGFKPEAAVGAAPAKIPLVAPTLSKPIFEKAASNYEMDMADVASKSDALDIARAELISMPFAGPWRRFWARTVDLWVFSIAVGLMALFLIGPIVTDREYLLGMVLLPFVLLLETCVFAALGNSPGKALLGIRVTTVAGATPTFRQYFERSTGMYFYGLALGVPFVSMFTMIKQYQLLQSERQATYDRGVFSVRAAPLGPVRWTISAIGTVIFICFVWLVSSHIRA